MTAPAPVATAEASPNTELPPVKLDFFAGVMSYLLPGMGQISQGRISKGIVFFVSLHALFFYGMYLGQWQNVWLSKRNAEGNAAGRFFKDVLDRPHFAAQIFMGMSAWPALYQYCYFEENPQVIRLGGFQRAPSPQTINDLQRNSDKTWDLGWIYTVIAGVLNILVIYDAVAGPAFREVPAPKEEKPSQEPAKT